jgi:hypothetical protein
MLCASFNTASFVETEDAGIISAVLQEKVSETELDAINEGNDLSLKTG